MPRQRYTLAQLKDRLRERAGNNDTFWTDPELKDALNEAISVYQALTGEWTTQKNIPAVSSSPSFYPVPKEIVSLTRVGTDSDVSTANPLGGTILVEKPAFESDVTLNFYHTAWDVDVPMRFIPVGGVGPYSITWTFGDGETAHSGLELISHTWHLPAGVDQFAPTARTITATVTDVTGDVFVATFPLTIIDPEPTIWTASEGEYVGIPYTFTFLGYSGNWAVLQSQIYTMIEYNGASFTNYGGNIYGGRYPMTTEFDFQPSPGVGVSGDSGRAQIEKVELWDFTNTQLLESRELVGGGELRFSHYMTDFSQWNNGRIRFLRGFLDGIIAREDPDNIVSGPSPTTGAAGYVKLYMRRTWYDSMMGIGNFKVSITDGTGKKVTKWAEYSGTAPTRVFGHIACGSEVLLPCPGTQVDLIDPYLNSITTVTDGSSNYEFTSFAGLTLNDGDNFNVHAYPEGCPGADPCPGGTGCLDKEETFSPWAWGTEMQADVTVDQTVIPCVCPSTAIVEITQTTPDTEYFFDGSPSTCAGGFAWDFGDGTHDFLNMSVTHVYDPGYVGTRVFCSLTTNGESTVYFDFVVGVDTHLTAGGPGTGCCPS